MRAWRTACPAKVNLFLAVGPPDQRTYHPLRTIFQAISLHDTLEVRESEVNQMVENSGTVPPDNTVTKALRLLRELLPIPPLEIHLTKMIPSEAGLGGGSSDAAGLIRIVQRMLPDDFPEHFAFEVAEAVGADVPFFLVGGRAKGEGYGQVLTPLPDPDLEPLLVAKPAASCSTIEAFKKLDAAPREWRDFPPEGEEFGFNDFERVAPCESLELIEWFEGRESRAMLTGSGSAVIGMGGNLAERERELQKKGVWCAPARFISRATSLAVEEVEWTS